MPTIIVRHRREGEEPLDIGVVPDPHLTHVATIASNDYEDGREVATRMERETGEWHTVMQYP